METTTLIGFELLAVAVAMVVGLTLRSRYIIETIHRRKLKSLREIKRELHNGR